MASVVFRRGADGGAGRRGEQADVGITPALQAAWGFAHGFDSVIEAMTGIKIGTLCISLPFWSGVTARRARREHYEFCGTPLSRSQPLKEQIQRYSSND